MKNIVKESVYIKHVKRNLEKKFVNTQLLGMLNQGHSMFLIDNCID